MLQRDPKRRATAHQILQHDWMKENGVASDQAIEMEVLTRIRKFSAGNRLKKEAIKVGVQQACVDGRVGVEGWRL
jgi:calcium-dependent protein kinase